MKYSNAVLEIPSFQQDDTGGYECVAENRMGKNTATGRLAFYGTKTFVYNTKNIVEPSRIIKSFYAACSAFNSVNMWQQLV